MRWKGAEHLAGLYTELAFGDEKVASLIPAVYYAHAFSQHKFQRGKKIYVVERSLIISYEGDTDQHPLPSGVLHFDRFWPV